MTHNFKRILITRTDRLGDVVLSTPVIRHLRALFPEAYMAFMVRPENRDVVANNPHLDEVILYDKLGSEKTFLGTMKFALKLKTKKFDLAFALHPDNRTHIVLFAAGIPMRVGYDRKMGWLLTKRIAHKKHEGARHEADYNFDLLREAGLDVEKRDIRPYIVTSSEEKRLVDSVLKDNKISGKFIALHAGASCPSKRWPVERFAEVGDTLSAKYSCGVVIVGGEGTEEFSHAVISRMKKKAVDLTGTLRVGELAELLMRASLFISNDSGPVHVAAAVGTPVIAIFGRSDAGLSPKRWGPLGEKDQVLHKNVGCEKCLAHNCDKDYACLRAITVEEVVQAACNILC